VKVFLQRPTEGDWPHPWIDTTYVKVRRNGRIGAVAVIVAVGVNGDGRDATSSLRIILRETNLLLADNRNSS
jgi:putative transposase